MKKFLNILLRLVMIIVLLIIIYFAGILIINSLYDYRPEPLLLNVDKSQSLPGIEKHKPYSMITWNLGYAGLGNNSDFFYDGGKMTRPAEVDFNRYWEEIQAHILLLDSVDFLLLQEVDIASHRSYGINQFMQISESFDLHHGVFAKNYDVKYVPMPLFKPMANVVSGICVFSGRRLIESCWRNYDGNRSWPLGLFMPDRGFIVTISMLPSGKKLFIINTHNSAFDDGSLRNIQLEILYKYMVSAYQNGNYVIAGGDWNINPKGYANEPFISGDVAFGLSGIQAVQGPDFNWNVVFDPWYPTNRDVSAPYVSGLTPTTIIDFFVCSPNITVLEIKTFYDGFKNSDHHPVFLRFKLK